MRKEATIGRIVKLKYCVRMIHSTDMPLNHPRLNCAFRGSSPCNSSLMGEPDDCKFHPAHIRYCEANGIDLSKNFGITFKCVI